MYRPLDMFLLRAPLLPEAALPRARKALAADRLGAQAIEVASPSLAAAKPGDKRDRALDRYARRAAFRATPSGLLAGVCMGRLGGRTAIATGDPQAYVAPSWGGVEAASRELLEDPDIRERTRLRVAPSAIRTAAGAVRWIGPGDPFADEREGELDDRLTRVLDAADRWVPWGDVRAQVGRHDVADHGHDGQATDEYLLMLVDDGLLHSDLCPPLIGPAAHVYVARKLAAMGVDRPLPERGGIHAVLVHHPPRPPALERAAVERASRLVPVLLALNDALSPPAAERFAQAGVADALDAATETFGAGAFDVGGLVSGDYGVDVGADETESTQPPSARAIVVLVNAIMDALARGQPEVELDPAAFADLPFAAPPPTAELFLAPMARPRGARPGSGWLLGLHAPAGASFGRFAHALGAPMAEALSALDVAERRARPSVDFVDLAFAPSAALADLAARPTVRRRTLAMTSWSHHDDLALRDLELVADPAEPEALALRTRAGREPIVLSPLARVRSAAAPAGIHRLLAGWSLLRQHATWALALGPLATLGHVPRIVIDGFVVSPASWRLPADRTRPALRRWRREMRVPRHVQVGDADELLPVDLDDRDAATDLAGHERAIEIWPPLGATLDRDGRRVEAIVMLVSDAGAEATRADHEVRAAEHVLAPRLAPPAPGWRSFRIYGASQHHDALLRSYIAPAVFAALSEGLIDGWFFLPYVDGPGRRPHLRLRVHTAGDPLQFERRLRAALEPARPRGRVTTVDAGDYHPERGRFTADELRAVFAMFESDSELCVRLPLADTLDRITEFVRAADALARGLGTDLAARHRLARDRRDAAERSAGLDDDARLEANAAFRAVGRDLRRDLSGEPGGDFLVHLDRVAAAAMSIPPAALLRLAPTLLHHSAVRFFGPNPDAERLGYTFWERTLDGLGRR